MALSRQWGPPTALSHSGIDVPEWKCHQPLTKRASTLKATTVGIDLAKNVFQVHAVDGAWSGRVAQATARPVNRMIGREVVNLNETFHKR